MNTVSLELYFAIMSVAGFNFHIFVRVRILYI